MFLLLTVVPYFQVAMIQKFNWQQQNLTVSKQPSQHLKSQSEKHTMECSENEK